MEAELKPALAMICIALASEPVTASPLPPSGFDNAKVGREASAALQRVVLLAGPGAAILIARGDDVIVRSARGSANLELGTPLSADHVFRIASVTKMFTAALLLKLTQERKLQLDDPLSKYLPEFSNSQLITIRQLLSHTAGLSDKALFANGQPGFLRSDKDLTTLVREIAKEPRRFAPGTQQAYSNAGYVLLGAVIEKVTGRSWHQALQMHILAPLALKRTAYGRVTDLIPGRVLGYTKGTDARFANADFISMSVPASAGALVSTVDDLHRWLGALSSGKAVGRAGFALMSTPADVPAGKSSMPYGFGLYVWSIRGEKVVGHTGQINGFASFAAHVPSRNLNIVVLSNEDTFDAQTLGRRLAATALLQPYAIVEPARISEKEMRSLAGEYKGAAATAVLTVRNGDLYYQKDGGRAHVLQPSRSGHLHFQPDDLSYFVPVRNRSGSVTRLEQWVRGEGPPVMLARIR